MGEPCAEQEVLYILSWVVIAQVGTDIKIYEVVLSRFVNFILCKLYLKKNKKKTRFPKAETAGLESEL